MPSRGRKPDHEPERTAVEASPGPAPGASGAAIDPGDRGPPRPRRGGRPPLHEPEATAPIAAVPGPRARIEYVSPDGKEHIRDLGPQTSVGRHTDNDIQLLDPEVSKHHLTISEEPDGFRLQDTGSANGTLVNGELLDSVILNSGDIIEVGNTRLRFSLLGRSGPVAARISLTNPAVGEPGAFEPEPTGPLTGPIDPFSEMLDRADLRSVEPERTFVTLVPEGFGPEPETNVFALPAEEDFVPASQVGDEVQLRRDYERLRVAFDLSLEVGLTTDLGLLGETILARIRDVLPADTAVIMLRGEKGELVPLASSVEVPVDDGEVRIPRAIVEQVIQTRGALLTSDAQADAALRSSHTVVGQQIRSALCVPLLAHDEVYGVIHLSTSSAAGAYEERDLALLRAIAQPAALAVANARLVQRIEEDAKTRAQLSRFLSPALVERVVKKNLSLETAGDKVLCSVLFCDIRGFTAMSDGAPPEVVVRMLNEYFEAMVEIVFEFGGVLDKFIGDELMAVWGTPVTYPDDSVRAALAADKMRRTLDELVNARRARRGEPPLNAGYGIATGRVIAGAMGARRRQDFTVIGDTVNLASRLCGQAQPGQILVCEDTMQLSTQKSEGRLRFTALEARRVKGVSRPVPVFELPWT